VCGDIGMCLYCELPYSAAADRTAFYQGIYDTRLSSDFVRIYNIYTI
jgi:hypothetical protein